MKNNNESTVDYLIERIQHTFDLTIDGYLIGQWNVKNSNQENDVYLASRGDKDSGFYLSEVINTLSALRRLMK